MKYFSFKSALSLIALIIIIFPVFGQTNFDNYSSLQSKGIIPDDFLQPSYLKIEKDRLLKRTSLSPKKEKVFLEGIHYSIDQLLHSGMVVFGDEISTYVERVADIILKDDPVLRKKLRFYTLKSNAVNAFSTDQGIIFVTIGLLAKLDNEAQLAFVLSHEIVHYTEKHVVQAFDVQTKKTKDQIESLSSYSKDRELEADRIGIELFLKAGYSPKEIYRTFDLLMESHLPYENRAITDAYFENSYLTIPEGRFPLDTFPIKLNEEFDDSYASHPNIKKRKAQVDEVIEKISTRGTFDYQINEKDYKNLVEIARFESLRIQILDGAFADAIYSIFLLEQKHPNSLFLNQMKAQAWFGLAAMKLNGKISESLRKKANYEGYSTRIHLWLKEASSDEIYALSLRNLVDIKNIYPKDKMIQQLYDKGLEVIFGATKFQWNKFHDLTFQEALLKSPTEHKDSADALASKYYYYALSDLKSSTDFNAAKKNIDEKAELLRKEKATFANLSAKQKKKLNKKKEITTVQKIIVLEPSVIAFNKKGIKLVKSEILSEGFSESIGTVSKELDMDISLVSSRSLTADQVEIFNEKLLLTSYLDQITAVNDNHVVSVDAEKMEQLITKYNTSKILLSQVVNVYKPRFALMSVVFSIIWPPVSFVVIPVKLLTGNNTIVNTIELDLSNQNNTKVNTNSYFDPVTKSGVKAYLYDIMLNVKQNKQ